MPDGLHAGTGALRRADRRRARRATAAPIWAGIGAYRLTPAQTVENIQTARRLGAAGVVLFSYDSLTDPQPAAPDYLAKVAGPPSRRPPRVAAALIARDAGVMSRDSTREMPPPFADV